jgi:DNA-binding winged helix-turn-helix (wHTH) protein
VSRFVPIWRFASQQRRKSKSGRLMRILILDDADQRRTFTEQVVRERDVEIPRADAASPIERLYLFAGWTLEETARDLVSPAGRRVDLTSSEFDLLLAFVRQPGQALSRDVLLGTLRGREWRYFDRSIDTLVARLRKKLAGGTDRPPLVRSVRGIGYIFCAAVAKICQGGQSAAA